MRTSSFSRYTGEDGVGIAIKSPAPFLGKSYSRLFPKWSFLSRYFKDHDQEAYTKAYHEQILDKLDPGEVWNDLKDSVLLCWEPPGQFCHRRLVADWLEKNLGVEVPEI